MSNTLPHTTSVASADRRPSTLAAATLAFAALLYAAFGIARAMQFAMAPSSGIAGEALLALLPSLAALASLWITQAPGLTQRSRRAALGVTLTAIGGTAVIAIFGV